MPETPEKQQPKFYYLIDSRGGTQAAAIETADLNKVDEEWERFVLLADTDPNQICHHANIGDYGDLCVVANGNGLILWEWFETGKWIAPERK